MEGCVKIRIKPLSIAAMLALLTALGCSRSKDAFDDRPLEKRPHVETVQPEDRKDAFRP
jgi:hypothetical protein